MRRPLLIVAALAPLLASCGGGGSSGRPSASGDISQACMAANRAAASPALCGCVQQVANQTLSARDRGHVADFFGDPEEAHAMRIDDSDYADAFWERYQNFVRTTETVCG